MVELETFQIEISTGGKTELVDITEKVQQIIDTAGFREGQANIFSIGSTTGITTIEYEPGLVKHDVAGMFNKFAPYGLNYAHNDTWNDDNGAAHLRSLITGCSINVPFTNSRLMLGTWQQIVFIDFDTRQRSRTIVVQIIGNK